MKTRRIFLVSVIALLSVFCFGCQDDAVVRQIALQLRASIIEDEQQIDQNIAAQNKFYKNQLETINNARTNNLQFNLDAVRRMHSAQAATNMSLNPEKEARLATLMVYLNETHDKEFEVWQKLYDGDQQAREDLKSKIAKLERQKKLLTQVKNNLDQLAIAPGSKKRARALLKFSEDTYAAFKKGQ